MRKCDDGEWCKATDATYYFLGWLISLRGIAGICASVDSIQIAYKQGATVTISRQVKSDGGYIVYEKQVFEEAASNFMSHWKAFADSE